MEDKLEKLLMEWKEMHKRCVEVFKKQPNEFLDGFMSSLNIRISELERVIKDIN